MNCTLVILLIILVCVFMGTKEGFVDFGLVRVGKTRRQV